MTFPRRGHYVGMRLLPLSFCLGAASVFAAQSGKGTIASRFDPPAGFTRVEAPAGSFGAYLRALPVKPAHAPVLLHNGQRKQRQDAHAAVVDMSVGTKDLQQCADAVMRLRAEHLFAVGRQDEIAFRFTSGFKAEWKRWRQGDRIVVNGRDCQWRSSGKAGGTHDDLLRFLEMVFTYAGTRSLQAELIPAEGMALSIGDVFIQGGSPGHAVLVVDVAIHSDGRMAFLLAQSYMPAQDIHVLRNPATGAGGSWYMLNQGGRLVTPEWTFDWSDRRRWP